MFVLGIDPGLSRCGYGCVEWRDQKSTAVAAGVIRTEVTDTIAARLAELQREIRLLIAELVPAVVAVERVLFQVNVRTAMSVGQASGIVMAEAANAGCEVVEYSPNQVKEAVAGYGKASKEQMQTMVRTLLGMATPLRPADAADAVGVALCHIAHAPMAAVGRSR